MMASILSSISQLFPPKATFIEKDIPDLHGKVYIVTGSNTGVGKELAEMLYTKHARVYVAARSKDKALKTIDAIKQNTSESAGELVFLPLDLADLSTIKKSAAEFLAKETKLNVLFNNAGVMAPPQGSKTAQGYELQLGTNNIGTFMFTKLLTPTLVATAKTEPSGTVRVIWVSSSAAEGLSPSPGGIPLDNLDYQKDKGAMYKYGVSKAGNYLHGTEFAKRFRADGVVSVSLNPGNLDSDLYRSFGPIVNFIIKTLVLYPPKFGAYTELFAGLSPKITIDQTGSWVIPWGRFGNIRKDLVSASKTKTEGGTGVAEKFWQWNEEQIRPYL